MYRKEVRFVIFALDLFSLSKRIGRGDSHATERGARLSPSTNERRNGVIGAKSAGKGHGATFIVELPLQIASLGRRGPTRASATVPPVDGLDILVVDDNVDTRETIGQILRQSGAEVHLAASAADAFTVLSQAEVDVLVSDIGMPTVDGYALITGVRSSERRSGRQAVTAVAVTAHAGRDARDRALAAGFDAHLAKPFDPAGLLAAIASARSRGVRDPAAR
jgi:CheY-like chemotaxis protein